MTQTSESGIKSRHSTGNRARANGSPTTSAENKQFRSVTKPQSAAWLDRLPIEQIADAATALLFACLAPALAMAAIWHTMEVAPIAFVLTFVIALAHAALLGLPLFLMFRSRGWINITTCIVFGFAIGAVPDGFMTWPMQHPGLYAGASVDGVITAAGWFSYVKALVYFGLLGALGGFTFWAVLTWLGDSGKTAASLLSGSPVNRIASRISSIHPFPAS